MNNELLCLFILTRISDLGVVIEVQIRFSAFFNDQVLIIVIILVLAIIVFLTIICSKFRDSSCFLHNLSLFSNFFPHHSELIREIELDLIFFSLLLENLLFHFSSLSL